MRSTSASPRLRRPAARYGLDLAHDLIPVAPAAHYFMGGVAVDTEARTTLPRLYAVGEVACTGVHGANRLASNSLLEGLVFGRRAARQIASTESTGDWPIAPALPGDGLTVDGIVPPFVVLDGPVATEVRAHLQRVMWERSRCARDAEGLTGAQREITRARWWCGRSIQRRRICCWSRNWSSRRRWHGRRAVAATTDWTIPNAMRRSMIVTRCWFLAPCKSGWARWKRRCPMPDRRRRLIRSSIPS